MTELLLYIARSGLYLGVFFAFYMLVMRRTTFFRLNRCALLIGSVICVLLPLFKVKTTSFSVGAGPLSIVGMEEPALEGVQAPGLFWPAAISAVYGLGALAVILFTLISITRMYRLIKTGEKRQVDGYRTYVLDGNQASFSFGRTIVICKKDFEENPAIFTHEKMHVRFCHYIDLLLFRLIQIVWWWNPLVWIMRTELGLLHEYEADESVIKKGVDATQYQLLLVRKAVGEQRFSLASGFQHAKLKNRIAMMVKPSSNGWIRLSYLALIPLLTLLAYACNPAKNNTKHSEEMLDSEITEAPATTAEQADPDAGQEVIPFQLIEQKPTFDGGDANKFAEWVNSQLKYPDAAKKAGTEGRVLLEFTVNTDGTMSNFKILKGVSPELDAEVLRVMSSCSQKWEPGVQDGKPVPVSFAFPVVFKLK